MEFEKQIAKLREEVEIATNKRNRAEGRLENLKEQRQQILNELHELGVNPEELDGKIKELEVEMTELLTKAEALMPKDVL